MLVPGLGISTSLRKRPDSLSRSTFYWLGDHKQQNGYMVLSCDFKMSITNIYMIRLDFWLLFYPGGERVGQAFPVYLSLAQILQSSCLSSLNLACTSTVADIGLEENKPLLSLGTQTAWPYRLRHLQDPGMFKSLLVYLVPLLGGEFVIRSNVLSSILEARAGIGTDAISDRHGVWSVWGVTRPTSCDEMVYSKNAVISNTTASVLKFKGGWKSSQPQAAMSLGFVHYLVKFK